MNREDEPTNTDLVLGVLEFRKELKRQFGEDEFCKIKITHDKIVWPSHTMRAAFEELVTANMRPDAARRLIVAGCVKIYIHGRRLSHRVA